MPPALRSGSIRVGQLARMAHWRMLPGNIMSEMSREANRKERKDRKDRKGRKDRRK